MSTPLAVLLRAVEAGRLLHRQQRLQALWRRRHLRSLLSTLRTQCGAVKQRKKNHSRGRLRTSAGLSLRHSNRCSSVSCVGHVCAAAPPRPQQSSQPYSATYALVCWTVADLAPLATVPDHDPSVLASLVAAQSLASGSLVGSAGLSPSKESVDFGSLGTGRAFNSGRGPLFVLETPKKALA